MHNSSIRSTRKIYISHIVTYLTNNMTTKILIKTSEHREAPCGSCEPKDGQIRDDIKRTKTETILHNLLSVRPTPTGGNEFKDQENNPDYSSGSLGLCSSNLGMYSMVSSRDDLTESCVTPNIKTSPFIDRRLCHVINNEINQMLFTSCTSSNYSIISKSSSFTRTNRRYQSMREGKEQRRQRHSQDPGSFNNDHQTGGEADLTLTSTHIYEEINDVVEGCDFNHPSISFSDQRTDFTSTKAPYDKTCVGLGERPPCEGQEASPPPRRKTQLNTELTKQVSRSESVLQSGYNKRSNRTEPYSKRNTHRRRLSCCLGNQLKMDTTAYSLHYQNIPATKYNKNVPEKVTKTSVLDKSPDVKFPILDDIKLPNTSSEGKVVISARKLLSRHLKKFSRTFKKFSPS